MFLVKFFVGQKKNEKNNHGNIGDLQVKEVKLLDFVFYKNS